MDFLYSVYRLRFKNTDRVYIGYTSNTIEKRFSYHWKARKSSNTSLSRYLRNINKEDVILECLYVSREREDALAAEIKLIAENKSMITQNGFNHTIGGENPPEGFGGIAWMNGKTEEEIAIINAKKSMPNELNPFYGKSHPKETLEKAVSTRRLNGSYNSETGSHLITEKAKEKNNIAKKNAAAKRYGYQNDQEFVNHIIDIYQECGMSGSWIACITNSNKPTIRKRLSMIRDGLYGEPFKRYVEDCSNFKAKLHYELQVMGREEFSKCYYERVKKPNIEGYIQCQQ